MTSKECLKRIDERNYLTQRERKEFLSVIEKDLVRLEQLEKALEIIKNKCATNTNLWLVFCTRTYEDYESFVENKDHKLVRIEQNILTQQEYELLKEALENDR